MISVSFTEEEVAEIANHTVFTAFHALDEDTDDARRVVRVALAIMDKLEAACPGLAHHEDLCCEDELFALRQHATSRQR